MEASEETSSKNEIGQLMLYLIAAHFKVGRETNFKFCLNYFFPYFLIYRKMNNIYSKCELHRILYGEIFGRTMLTLSHIRNTIPQEVLLQYRSRVSGPTPAGDSQATLG